MNRIILKSAAIAFASVAVSLLLTLIVVPAMGFPTNRTIWLTSTVCPLALAWGVGAYTFWQGPRIASSPAPMPDSPPRTGAWRKRRAATT